MNYLHSLVANSNGTLDRHIPIINAAMDLANKYTSKHLNFKEKIDVIFVDDPRYVISETCVGGYTPDSIRTSIYLDGKEQPSLGTIFDTIVHECCHSVRWQNNSEWSDTLLKSILFEGMATKFGVDACHDNHQTLDFFQQYVIDNQTNAPEIIKTFGNKLYKKMESHYIDFIGGDGNKLPHWSGYIVGYYLAKSLMDDHGLSISDLCSMKYDDMINLLSDKLPVKL